MAITAILAALAAAGSAIGSAAAGAAGAAGSAAGAVGGALGSAGSAIGSAAGSVGSALGEAAGSVGSALGEAGGAIGEAAQGAGNAVQGLWGGGAQGAGQVTQAPMQGVQLASNAGMGLSDVPELGSLASYTTGAQTPVNVGGNLGIGQAVNPATVSPTGGATGVPAYPSNAGVNVGGNVFGSSPQSPGFLQQAMPYLKKYGPMAMKMMGGGGGGGGQMAAAPPAQIGALSQSPYRQYGAGPMAGADSLADRYDWRRYL